MTIPLTQISPAGGLLSLSRIVLGDIAYSAVGNALKLTTDAVLTGCKIPTPATADLLIVEGTLASLFGQGTAILTLYLFEVAALSGDNERHAILLFTSLPKALTSSVLVKQFCTSAEIGGMPAELSAFGALTFATEANYLLFSSLDYSSGNYQTPPFPPAQDSSAPQNFLKTVRDDMTAGYVWMASFQLGSSITIPAPSGDTTGMEPYTLDLSAVLTPLGLQKFCADSFAVNAQMKFLPSGAQINLLHPLSPVLSAGSLPFAPSLTQVGIGVPLGSGLVQIPIFLLDGTLTLGSAPSDVSASFDFSTEKLAVSFSKLPDFKDLASHFSKATDTPSLETLLGNFLPSGVIQDLGELTILELNLSIDCSSPSVDTLSFSLTTDKPLTLFDKIEIQPALIVKMTRPFESFRTVEADVLGRIYLNDSELDVLISVTRGTAADDEETMLMAKLALGSSVKIADLTDKLFHEDIAGLSSLIISDVEFMAVKSSAGESISFEIDVAAGWVIEGLTAQLDNLSLNISFDKNTDTKKWALTEATVQGNFEIGQVFFHLSADYYAGDWIFSGATENVAIGDVITTLGKGFGMPFPATINSLKLQFLQLELTVGSESHSFKFNCLGSIAIGGVDVLFSVLIDLCFVKGSWASGFSGTLIFKTKGDNPIDIAFEVTFSERHTEKVFNASYKSSGERQLKLQDIADAMSLDLPDELNNLDLALDGVSFDYDSSNESLRLSVQGKVSGNAITFEIIHAKTQEGATTSSFFGGNIHSSRGNSINLGGSFPIQMGVTDLFVAKISHTPVSEADSFTVFGSDLNVKGDIDLGSLPVVGDFLKEAKFSFNALRIVYANAQIKADKLTGVNEFLKQIEVAPLLTPQSTVANNSSAPAPFAQGFSLQGSLVLGDNGEVIPLHSGFSGGQSGTKSAAIKDTPAPQTPLDVNNATSPATPALVGKKFGPLSIESVSLGLKGSEVCLTVSGGLLIGPLGVDFIGFEISSPVNKFSPAIGLHGLGLAINKPPLALNGLFVNSKIDVPNGTDKEGKVITKQIDGYSGSLIVGYKDYALTAMGSYAKLPDGVTSIFIYGFLGAPLGGLPGILMITGAAAGFGYNRAFNLPSPESINTFPLIQPVIPGNTLPVDFDAMNLDFMPLKGSFWGAVGIRVESFKMIESFVLLALKFNVVLEIDILGIASMQFPVPDVGSSKPPLARIGIGLVARILPERGIVAVNGVFLPGSYIFDPNAVITGGFAMLTVFKDQADGQWSGAKEGDFILTLGGYGPVYKPEAYYPQVSRLEMNWKVSDALLIKADTYFAITPQAMMVGGHMVADFQEGGDFSIHAVFTVGADFIIYWKPYRYLGHMYADLAVAASINVLTIHTHVDFDLSADLKIWGPSFSGYASVSVHALVSFTVCIAFGEDEQIPQPISWDDFSSGFLPALDKILSVNIGRGLIASQSSPAKESIPAINVVNAKELVVILGTAIPVKVVSENTGVKHANTAFGIKPMANTEDDFKSELTLNVSKDGKDMSTRFSFEPITKNMPSALWQPADKDKSGKIPDNDDSSLINDLLSGVRISAIDPVAGTSCTISVNEEDIISTASATKGASFSYGTGFSRAA